MLNFVIANKHQLKLWYFMLVFFIGQFLKKMWLTYLEIVRLCAAVFGTDCTSLLTGGFLMVL